MNEDFRMKLNNAIVGRGIETESIKMQFDNLLEGNSALTIISGDIGVGKTALVKRTLADLSKLDAVCIYGKFEQYKDSKPYIAIIQIVENIISNILTLHEEQLRRVSQELIRELGKDGALIIDITPRFERVIGKQKKVSIHDYQKLKIRLGKAFQKLIYIAAKELYPLTIFIDDFQWADKPSWDILKAIHDDLDDIQLYIILAYRDNLQEYRDKMQLMLNEIANSIDKVEIKLRDLRQEDIERMLLDIFAHNIDASDDIARIIYRKTLGNPLYINQMLQMIIESGHIYYDCKYKEWLLRWECLDNLNLPAGIKDIVTRRVQELGYKTKELLEIAACIGGKFNFDVLIKITQNTYEVIKERLEILCEAGLIAETFELVGETKIKSFEFSHDHINQIVYEAIDPDIREQLHFDIAIKLLNHPERIYVEDHLLTITAHLLKCKNRVFRKGKKDRLIVDLYFAGIKAKQSAAIEHALKLFLFCEELLSRSCWEKDYDNTLKIKLELAECQFISGLYEDSKAHFEEMLGHALHQKDLSEIKKRYMILNSYIGKYSQVLELGIQALHHLGFKINRQGVKVQIVKEILSGKFLFRSNRLQAIKNAPIINDKRIVDALEILNIMAASANLTDEDLFALIVLKISNLSAKHGNSLYAPIGYAAYSLVLGSLLDDFKKSKEVEKISLSLLEFIDDDALKCTTYFIIGTFIHHWTYSAYQSFNYLQKSFDCGIKSGEFFYGGFTVTSMIEMKYSMGEPLCQIEEFLRLHQKYGRKMNHDILLRLIRIFSDHINMLTKQDFPLKNRLIDDEEINKLATNEVMTYYLLKLQRLYFEGKADKAFELSQKCVRHLDSVRGYILQVDFVFYFLLLSLEKERNKESFAFGRQFVKYRKKMKEWAKMSPENHNGKHLLIEAFYKSLKNQQQDAAKLYDKAIEHAKDNKNLLLEALGNYLTANHYSDHIKISKVYAQDAYRLFKEWGSVKTAHRISRLYDLHDDFSLKEITAASSDISDLSKKKLSFDEKIEKSQKELEVRESEDAFKYFLNIVCVESNADSGAVLFEETDKIQLKCKWTKGRGASIYSDGIDMEKVENLPKKILRYAARTYEEVIIDAKPDGGHFCGDDYIETKSGISIICLPLKYKDIFVGLIYLESQRNHGFETVAAEFVKRLSFYLTAKKVLEKEPEKNRKIFTFDKVKDQITDREAEVLSCMAMGMSNKEIGEKLGISSSTVKTHTLNLYGKLEVSNRVQAVTKAKKLKLL